MLLEFTKMHGLGNDFMVVDLISQRVKTEQRQLNEIHTLENNMDC